MPNNDSWKQHYLKDPNKKPVATCPYCSWEATSVIEAYGRASHLWSAHGIPGEFTMNGKTTYYGEQPELSEPFDWFGIPAFIKRLFRGPKESNAPQEDN